MAVCLILQALAVSSAFAAEDPLLLSYSASSEQHVALLKECAQRLDLVKATATKSGPGVDWSADENVRWLLANRMPAFLRIERELDADQPGPYLAALVWISARLGQSELVAKLPGTLAKADTDEARLVIIQVLADVRSPAAIQSLEKFLKGATAKTPEALVVAACEGLGHTRDAAHLALIVRSAQFVHSPAGRVHMAAARQECGDPIAADQLLDVLRDGNSAPELRAFVLVFLADHPLPSASPVVADAAVNEQDESLAQLGLDVLMKLTGYDMTLTEPPAKAAAPSPGADAKTPAGPKLEDFAKLSKEDRTKLTTEVLDWWHAHPQGVVKPGAAKTPPPPQ